MSRNWFALADYARTESWTLRGPIDAQCAKCEAMGVELRMRVMVEMTADVCLECDEANRYKFGMTVVDGDHPVEMECLSCGMVVRYGEVAALETG